MSTTAPSRRPSTSVSSSTPGCRCSSSATASTTRPPSAWIRCRSRCGARPTPRSGHWARRPPVFCFKGWMTQRSWRWAMPVEREQCRQHLDLLVIVDGAPVAVEVKTRYTSARAGRLTRAGNLPRPRLRRAAREDGHRQGSQPYLAARVQGWIDTGNDMQAWTCGPSSLTSSRCWPSSGTCPRSNRVRKRLSPTCCPG